MVDWQQWLERDKATCGGHLRAKGTRVPVFVILDSLAEGATHEQILGSYPTLTPAHIAAVMAYDAQRRTAGTGKKGKRISGRNRDNFKVSDDFNAPDPEIEAMFYDGDVFPPTPPAGDA